MSKINLLNEKGEAVGELDFADELLVLDKGDQAVKDVVVATLAARRAGTASTLGKGEVAGSNKKPWRQKGTGRARSGFRQSPVWRGGGIAMGPKPRSFTKKVNRKVAALAFRRALSTQIIENKLSAISDFVVEGGKTRNLASILKTAGVQGGSVLLITDKIDSTLALAARNIPKVNVLTASQLDVYSMLASRALIASKEAISVLEARMRQPEVA